LPWLYALPPDLLRWFLLILTASIVAWAGAASTRAPSRPAPRNHQHEHAGEPGNGRGLCLFRLCHDLARAGRQVYFDAVLLILGFLLLGKALEARAKRRALAALDSLSRLRPVTARRIRDGVQAVVPLEEIQPGDSVLVLPGERFPVDATILKAAPRWTNRCSPASPLR
jgi:P-type Cu+ transporter